MSAQTPATLLDQDAVRRAVDTTLADYLSGQIRNAHHRGLPQQAVHALSDFRSSGGKRIRPVLCVAGWQAAGGTGAPDPVLKAAASQRRQNALTTLDTAALPLHITAVLRSLAFTTRRTT